MIEEKKEMPESALDYLLQLWAQERNLEIIEIKKEVNTKCG